MARSRSRHLAIPLVMVLLLGGIAGGSYVALSRYGDQAATGTCTASGLGTSHRYETDQVASAALISAISVDRGLPPRAASIALATAYQESQLRNIDYGDRDSVGLFQQRPSQGWGTEAQLMDPVYSTNTFYDALLEVEGYESMDINDAAQTVQRSGFPEAYADHETEGRLYASALTGRSGANVVCSLEDVTSTASPETVRGQLERHFPRLTASGGITSRLAPTGSSVSTATEGAGATALVIDTGGEESLGWSIANWAVARAAEDGIVQVSYRGLSWDRALRGAEGEAWSSTSEDADDVAAQDEVVVLLRG